MKKLIVVGFIFVLAAAGAITYGIVTATPVQAATIEQCEACGYPHSICVAGNGNPCVPNPDICFNPYSCQCEQCG
ncbi:MAG: hypothetical protein HY049_19660 [Acidobacteria bacterium]|nr:hypothetical protein [Acidobacteriota bacterium]